MRFFCRIARGLLKETTRLFGNVAPKNGFCYIDSGSLKENRDEISESTFVAFESLSGRFADLGNFRPWRYAVGMEGDSYILCFQRVGSRNIFTI